MDQIHDGKRQLDQRWRHGTLVADGRPEGGGGHHPGLPSPRRTARESAQSFRMKTRISTLENGITVATAETLHMASVSLGIWVGVGGRFEPAEVCGVSHFIEHMLF